MADVTKTFTLPDGEEVTFTGPTEEAVQLALIRHLGEKRFSGQFADAPELTDVIPLPTGRGTDVDSATSLREQFPDISDENIQKFINVRQKLGTARDDVGAAEVLRNEFGDDLFIFPATVGEEFAIDPSTVSPIAGAQPLIATGAEFGEAAKAPREQVFFNIPSVSGDFLFTTNKQGLSAADTRPLAAEVILGAAQALPLARLGGAAAKGIQAGIKGITGGRAVQASPLIGRIGEVLGTAGAGAATSLELDVAAGIKEGRAERAKQTAIAFGAGEILAPIFIGLSVRGFQRVKGMVTAGTLIKNGKPTEKFKALAAEENISLKNLTPEAGIFMSDLIKQGASKEQIIQGLKAATLPVPVKLTRGQLTRDPRLRTLEREAREGLVGEELKGTAAAVQREQLARLGRNVPEAQQRINPSRRTPEEVQDSLITRREQMKEAVDDTFKEVREKARVPVKDTETGKILGEEVTGVRPESAQQLLKTTSDLVESFPVEAGEFPGLRKALNFLEDLSKSKTTVSIGDLIKYRQILTNAGREGKAVKIAKDEFDKFLGDAGARGLLFGDDEVIKLFFKGKEQRALLGEIFERQDIIALYTNTLPDGTGRLAVQPDEMANLLFGRGRLDLKKGLLRDVKKLEDVLSPEEFSSIKEAAFMRFFRNAPDVSTPAAWKAYSKELELALRDSPKLMKELFTPEDIAFMRQLDDVARTVLDGGDVPAAFLLKSQTIGDYVQRGVDRLPIPVFLISRPLEQGRKVFARRAIRRSLAPGAEVQPIRGTPLTKIRTPLKGAARPPGLGGPLLGTGLAADVVGAGIGLGAEGVRGLGRGASRAGDLLGRIFGEESQPPR